MVAKVIRKVTRKLEREASLVQSRLSYRRRIFLNSKKLPELSPASRLIVDQIGKEGVCITSLDALSLPETGRLWNAARAVLPGNPRAPSTPDEYVYVVRPKEILRHPDIYLWGLQDRLLDIVENYLGVQLAYRGPFFQRDFANGLKTVTRLWHKDPEDHRILKVVVYLNDVGIESGPLEYISRRFDSKLSSLKGTLFYSDAEVGRFVNPEVWVSCTGLAGTVVFFDPHAVFHRGKVPVAADRDAIFYNYHSREPIKVYGEHWKTLYSHDDLAQLSMTVSPRQKQCVFWWEHSENADPPAMMTL